MPKGKYTADDVQGAYTDADVATMGQSVDRSTPPPPVPGQPGLVPVGRNKAGIPIYHGKPVQPPGFWGRLGESLGIPTSMEQLRAMGPGMQLFQSQEHPTAAAVGNAVVGPAGEAARAAINYGRNLASKATDPMTPAEQADMAKHPVGQAVNQGAKFIEEGVLAPVGGQAVSNIATDIGQHDWGAAGGDILGTIANLFALKHAPRASGENQIEHLTAGAGAKASTPIERTVGTLVKTAQDNGAQPKTVGDFLDTVNSAKTKINQEYGNAIGPYAKMQMSTQPIADRIMSLITPDMEYTAEGRADIAEIKAAAREYENIEQGPPVSQQVPTKPIQGPPPFGDEVPTREQTIRSKIDQWFHRAAQDQAGQNVLDEMEANGEKVGDISKKFWDDTYWKLPGPIQERFQRYVKSLWGGAKPGEVYKMDKNGNGIVANDWMDLANNLGIADEPQYLEGTERGYVVMMKLANENASRFRQAADAAATAAAKPPAPMIEGGTTPPSPSRPGRKLWTLGALDSKRSRLAADLASHNAKEPVSRYTAERGSTKLAIDNAINAALRDTVYPEADRLAGKPEGYFESMKQQQANLIRLESLLNQRIDTLKGQSRVSHGEGFLSRLKGGVAVSSSGKPHGYIANLANAVHPEDVLAEANKATKRGFSKGSPTSKAIVMSYPIRALSLNQPTPWWEQK